MIMVGYENGADFWRDNAVSYGIDEAVKICRNYLDTQLRQVHSEKPIPEDEVAFCRDMFKAMYEATAGKTDPAKLVYPLSEEEAERKLNKSHYQKSAKKNSECAFMVDENICFSRCGVERYNFDIAAMKLVCDYGFERVQAVLAKNIQTHPSKELFSEDNRKWANGKAPKSDGFLGATLDTHPNILDTFASKFIAIYSEICADRYFLPGQSAFGEFVADMEIVQAIAFDSNRGFVIAEDIDGSQFVCWQFTQEDDKRDYYWGDYGSLDVAIDSYIARVIVHMSDGITKEIPFVPVKTEPPLVADADEQKPISVLEIIKAAEKQPKPPGKSKTKTQNKKRGDVEI